MARLSNYLLAALAAPAALVNAAPAGCDSCTERVIVVRMGEDPALAASSSSATPSLSALADIENKAQATTTSFPTLSITPSSTIKLPMSSASTTIIVKPTLEAKVENTTEIYIPVTPERQIEAEPVNRILPRTNVSMSYGSASASNDGKIHMALNMSSPAVLLEDVDGVKGVKCPTGSIIVAFDSADDYSEALSEWALDDDLVLITNHGGNCDYDAERGFYVGSQIVGDAKKQTITITSKQVEISDIAESFEMEFSSIPAGSLSKRMSLNPSTSVSFSKALPNDTVLFTDYKYINVTADEAWFSTTITFSGKLNYNFWKWKVEALYFDLDVAFDSEVAISAEVKAKYMQVFKYAPQDLTYNLVSIPGIIQLGPGVQFAVGAEIDVDAAVDVTADLSFSIPDGKVHVDLLSKNNTSATGFDKPVYSASANISENAVAKVNPNADLTVQLAFKLLGGLIDLSTGVSMTSSMTNTFQLVGDQGAGVDGVGNTPSTDVSLPASCAADIENGIALKSDLIFNLTGFATKYWSGKIYSTSSNIVDKCWSLPTIKDTVPTTNSTLPTNGTFAIRR